MADARDRSVVFVHGLWLHADSWTAWVERFRAAGYSPSAPGWPGEPPSVVEAGRNPQAVAGYGIGDVVDHYARIVTAMGTTPIAVGHSFGGLIVQRLLAQGLASAAVAIDPAPIKGVLYLPPSALRVASVALRNPANRKKAVSLTEQQFRYGFGNALTAEESQDLYERWAIASPGKPLFEAASANLSRNSAAKVDTKDGSRGPLLVTAGGRDHTVPKAVSKATVKLYKDSQAVTDYREFPDRGHSLTIDSGWAEVADAALAWLGERGL